MLSRRAAAAAALTVTSVACLAIAPPGSAARPLRTAIADAEFGPTATVPFRRTRSAGATMARLTLNWRGVAPRRPAEPANPRDRAYNWAAFDQEVTLAVERGLQPIVTVMWAPRWAQGAGTGPPGTVRPDPVALGRFARAAATRYSGAFVTSTGDVLPAVRHWQVWNEPNRRYFLSPQYVNGSLVAADWYRAMVNRFAAAAHDVNRANVVVAGGLAPFGRRGHAAPLAFMRDMLCMSRPPHRAVCAARARFDAWSTHPYTSGGPTHRAFAADDVSIGDLPEMRRLLSAAVRSGRVVSSRRVQFWVTEFAWDSDPPDRYGVPIALHARWVAEGLYRMWRSGVSVVTWFLTRDHPRTPYQSGLYFRDGRPKLAWQAFRFPFVAFVSGGRVYVWGRTPWGEPDRVVVQQKTSRRWRTVAVVSTNGYGIFSRRLSITRRGLMRARLADGSAGSVPFSLARPRECFVNPFGEAPPPPALRPVC